MSWRRGSEITTAASRLSNSSEASKSSASGKKGRPVPEEVRADLFDLTKFLRSRMWTRMREGIVESSLSDPDMWDWVQELLGAALRQFLEDVEHELEKVIEVSMIPQKSDNDMPGPTGESWYEYWYTFRAFVLHHYLPHDKSIFGKLGDLSFIVMYAITLLPYHGVRVGFFAVLLVMLLQRAPDEHQLINFILLFKNMQFLTSGFLLMLCGLLQYYACYSWSQAELAQCVEAKGPGAVTSFGQLLDYLGSVGLVWIAFCALPSSTRFMGRQSEAVVGAVIEDDITGRRLRLLLFYDVVCFVVSLICLAFLTICTWTSSNGVQFQANVFLCIILYSLLSFPFALFQLPGFQALLTHSDPTGYNRNGACVRFVLRKDPDAPEEEEAVHPAVSRLMAATAGFLRVAARGRVARGGDRDGDLRYGDFTRGVFIGVMQKIHRAKGRTSGTGSCTDEESPANPNGASPPSATGSGHFPRLWGVVSRLRRERQSCAYEPWAEPAPLLCPATAEIVSHTASRTGRVSFCIEVTARASHDSEFSVKPWRVSRGLGDLQDLARRLDVLRKDLGGVAFPDRGRVQKFRSWWQRESLARDLDVWLQKVLEDRRSQSDWAPALSDFFSASFSPRRRLRDRLGVAELVRRSAETLSSHAEAEAQPCVVVSEPDGSRRPARAIWRDSASSRSRSASISAPGSAPASAASSREGSQQPRPEAIREAAAPSRGLRAPLLAPPLKWPGRPRSR